MNAELAWNSRGLLNPILSPTGMKRAPYTIDILSFIRRFGTTAPRRKILNGFLEYREELHKIGLGEGFQWIDGSFVEDIEALEQRPPSDIDVVTFYKIPAGESQSTLYEKKPVLFPTDEAGKDLLKELFPVDGSMTSLDAKPRLLVKQTIFWYSLWSHRRDQTWKGFVQIDLASKDDADAKLLLDWLDSSEMGTVNED